VLKCVKNRRALTGMADVNVSQMFFFYLSLQDTGQSYIKEEVSVLSREMYFSSVSAKLGALFTGPGMCL
jgi:hypothetical protein